MYSVAFLHWWLKSQNKHTWVKKYNVCLQNVVDTKIKVATNIEIQTFSVSSKHLYCYHPFLSCRVLTAVFFPMLLSAYPLWWMHFPTTQCLITTNYKRLQWLSSNFLGLLNVFPNLYAYGGCDVFFKLCNVGAREKCNYTPHTHTQSALRVQ